MLIYFWLNILFRGMAESVKLVSTVRFEKTSDGQFIDGVSVTERVYEHLRVWLSNVASKYDRDVLSKVSTILTRSLKTLSNHRVRDFIPYGKYNIFRSLGHQLIREFEDPYYEPRPYLVVLYGPPGTGKTTWVRNVARETLVHDEVRGVYLEVTPGDLQSKWVGVPLNTLQAIFDCVRTRNIMSVVLFDEADGIFVRPQDASSGFTLEWNQLVSEAKASLSAITSENIPTLIALTTNYKESIIESDPALADRVTAWIEVPPPPVSVKEQILAKTLARMVENIWTLENAFTQLNLLKTLKEDLPPVMSGDGRGWVFPSLPFDADYIIGYLSAWGWNPLDEEFIPALTMDFRDAVRLWDVNNPILKVYARGLLTEVEVARVYISKTQNISKSFLRMFTTMKRGIEDFERMYVDINVRATKVLRKAEYSIDELYALRDLGATYITRDNLSRKYEEIRDGFREAVIGSLFTSLMPPSLIHVMMTKYLFSDLLSKIVNDIQSMGGYIVAGLKHLFLPALLVSTDNPYENVASLRYRIGLYNRFVKEQLVKGELLKPLRIIYTEKDSEKAWNEAVRALNDMEPDLRPYVAIALIPLKFLHRVIHTPDIEEKAKKICEIYFDREKYIEEAWKVAEELQVEGWVYALLSKKTPSATFLVDTHISVVEMSFLNNDIFCYFSHNPYSPKVDRLVPVANPIRFRYKNVTGESWS